MSEQTSAPQGATPAAMRADVPPDMLARMGALARVPEHSLPLMTALSQGEPFCIGPFFFLAAEDWRMGVACPLE
ncbi:hypothetical protein, partial [Desulfovibrio sp.]|uniref:hypothetical protein n=1 Tax=Desulfovibrio sp. TaxID=885 RepID=UPI002621687B